MRTFLRQALLVSLSLLAFASSGCTLFYKHSHRGPEFTLYSDRGEEFLDRVAAKASRIYEGFGELFEMPPERLGRTSIVLQGEDSGVIDYRYAPDILGYYIPLLNYISIDAAPCSQSGELLDQVLLHEISHHFVVTDFPPASGECWLNEGLAGALEMAVFDGERLEYPLLNPILYQVAQHAIYSKDGCISLAQLVGMSWGEFHRKETKERNYALAWATVYFLLERNLSKGLPLGKRIKLLYDMDRKAIAELEPEWLAFVRGFDITGHLLELAKDRSPSRRLSSIWAVRQLGSLRAFDDLRILEGLTWFFDEPDPVKRASAYLAFLQKLERASHSFFLSQDSVRHGVQRISKMLEDPVEPEPMKEAVAVALGASFKTREQWLYPLVTLLDGGDGELRAAAAQTLSRIAEKPTIVNPAFWRAAPAPERNREVAEWRDWLARQEMSGESGQ